MAVCTVYETIIKKIVNICLSDKPIMATKPSHFQHFHLPSLLHLLLATGHVNYIEQYISTSNMPSPFP